MRQYLRLAIVLLVAAGAGHALAGLKVAGSSTMQPAVREAAENFAGNDATATIYTQGGGSDAGIRAVLAGSADIGMVSRPLSADEARHLKSFLIGRDGLALVVHERNGVSNLTRDQVRMLFSGRVVDWREVGASAPAGIVVPVMRAPGRASRQLFDQHFAIGMVLPTRVVELGTNLAALLYLSIDPQAVGYVSIGSLTESRRRGLKVKGVALDGVAPSLAACFENKYPLCRPLLLVTRDTPSKEAARFIAFMASPTGRTILEQHGFMPPAEPAR